MLCIGSNLHVQAGQICAALEEHGEAHLESWQVPMLTWDELQELKQLYDALPISALENPLAGGHQHFAQQHLLLVQGSLLAEETFASADLQVLEGC